MDEIMSLPSEPPSAQNPPAEKKPGEWTSRSKEVLEVSGKMIIGAAGLCYVLGLLVVTMHLRQFGLNSLDLPQLHYVTAGVWTLLPIVIVVLLLVFGFYMLAGQKDEIKSKRGIDKVMSVFGAIAGIMIVSFLVLKFLGAKAGLEFGWVSWVLIPILGLVTLLCMALPAVVLAADLKLGNRLVLSAGLLVIGLASSGFYITLFADHTYETIPWSTGGGRPSQVRLVVAPESRPYLESVGVGFSASQTQTDSLKLLLTTEKELVIVNSRGQAVGVPSETVKLVVYEK